MCQDAWPSLAEALGSYLWGDNQKVPVPQTQRAADITEQFETLYARYRTRKCLAEQQPNPCFFDDSETDFKNPNPDTFLFCFTLLKKYQQTKCLGKISKNKVL